MRIFGPLPWPTISPVTVTPARACASLVTVSPSTRSRAGRLTVSPASPARRLTVNRSPTATLCWLPPAFTTAYTTDSSFNVARCPARTRRSGRRVLDGVAPARAAAPGGARGGDATRPAYPSAGKPAEGPRPHASLARGEPRDGRRSGRRAGRAAGRPAPARPRGRADFCGGLGTGGAVHRRCSGVVGEHLGLDDADGGRLRRADQDLLVRRARRDAVRLRADGARGGLGDRLGDRFGGGRLGAGRLDGFPLDRHVLVGRGLLRQTVDGSAVDRSALDRYTLDRSVPGAHALGAHVRGARVLDGRGE